MDDIQRTFLSKISRLMTKFPAVVIIGARQVGKTTILKQVLPSSPYFDLENEQDFTLSENDPEIIFKDYQKPIIFDEAQLSKNLFKALRVEIDKTKSCGQFLLSGSSSPELLQNISESLAGRIAIIEIPTFNFSEAHDLSPSKFSEWINDIEKLKTLPVKQSEDRIFESCLFGGYPTPYLKRDDLEFIDEWFSNYFKTYIERDVRGLFPTLKLDSYKKFIKMLTVSSGEVINASGFARSLDVSQPTVKKYLEIANGTFIWRHLPSFENNIKKTVIKMPKGHMRDSGLLCFLLNINSIEELKNHPHYGRIWESFIIEEILKGIDLSYGKKNYYFYRTKAGAEIDLILEGRFGIIPIEIKSGISTPLKQTQNLKLFVKENNCSLGILINRGEEVKMLGESIIQVPVKYL